MKFKLLLVILFIFNQLYAQRTSKDNAGWALNFNFSTFGHLAGGDLKQRFGNATGLGTGAEFMSQKGNWIVGGDFGYWAGKTVKENPLTKMYNGFDDDGEGYIYGGDFEKTYVFLRERGLWYGGYIGKLIPLSSSNGRSGIRITIGSGFMQHKIRLQDDSKSVIQLEKPYVYGFDRKTGGVYLSEFIGYQVLSKNRRINFTIGFDFMQGFTKSLRDWDWDKKAKDTARRKDLLNGIKASWTIPFYIGENSDEIFY